MAREQAARLEERAAGEVLASADVVAATCVGAGDARLAGRAFRLAVLDEACQATEPAALIALLQARAHTLGASALLAPETFLSGEAFQPAAVIALHMRLPFASAYVIVQSCRAAGGGTVSAYARRICKTKCSNNKCRALIVTSSGVQRLSADQAAGC